MNTKTITIRMEGKQMRVDQTFDTKHKQQPLFVIDAMQYPWTWVWIGAGVYVRYIPERHIVQLGRIDNDHH